MERWQRIYRSGGKEVLNNLEEGEKPPDGWEKSKFGALDFRASHPPIVTGDTFKLSHLQLAMQEITVIWRSRICLC